jgi:branched-chain amino acid transport system permease protein
MERRLLSQLIQYAIGGLTTGSIYAIVAVGFGIVFNTTGITNFAQGQFVVLGGLTLISLVSSFKLPFGLSIGLAVIAVVMASLVFERLLMRRTLKEGSHLIVVLLTLSAAFLIAGIAMVIWGKQALPLPAFSGEKAIPFIAGTRISPQSLWVMGSTLVMTALLACFFRYTFTGKAMRATADNKMAAILMGVNAQFMVVISFAMSAAAGAIAGMVIAPITFMSYDAGMMLTIKGIVAAVLGGMGSNLGALLGGLILGLLEAYSAGLASSLWKDGVALLALVIVMLVRPNGLLGKPAH